MGTDAVRTDRQRVARLFERAGFGATVAQVDEWTAKGYEAAVDHLLAFAPAGTRADEARSFADESSAPANGGDGFDLSVLQRRWLERMATTTYPLEEKLTLYWHGHFATAHTKVRRPQMMVRQVNLFRRLAAGSFRELCDAVTADPAMLLWLDGATSHAGAINENYGREFLELFTLGRGHYSQDDVREAARAFTGFAVNGQQKGVFDPTRHDPGEKVILGQRGAWAPADVTTIVLDRHPEGPVAARYLARRMAAFLHRPDPEPEVVAAMADAFVAGGHEIKPMVRALLLRPEFADGPALNVKAPAEMVAGVMRAFDLAAVPTLFNNSNNRIDAMADACTAMGQELFNPPDVSGWKGGAAWANTATALARYNFAAVVAKLVTDSGFYRTASESGGYDRPEPWMARLGVLDLVPSTAAAVDGYGVAAKAAGADALTRSRGVLTLLLASPDYNLR